MLFLFVMYLTTVFYNRDWYCGEFLRTFSIFKTSDLLVKNLMSQFESLSTQWTLAQTFNSIILKKKQVLQVPLIKTAKCLSQNKMFKYHSFYHNLKIGIKEVALQPLRRLVALPKALILTYTTHMRDHNCIKYSSTESFPFPCFACTRYTCIRKTCRQNTNTVMKIK